MEEELDHLWHKSQDQPENHDGESDDNHDDDSDDNHDDDSDDGGIVIIEREREQNDLSEPELVEYLESLSTDILGKLNAPSFEDIKHLKLEVTPFEHQKRAAGVIAQAKNSRFRGIVIADPPAFGKTLSSLLAPISEKTEGSGPVVVVAPGERTQLWVDEIHKMFEDTVSVLLLNDKNTAPTDLFKYTVVVTSYRHLASEYSRMGKFSDLLQRYRQAKSRGLDVNPPASPPVALLSGIWEMDVVKPLAKYLILDEVPTFKRISFGLEYSAVMKLRSRIDVCVMLAATPLGDNWRDAYTYLNLLGGHPIKSLTEMERLFTSDDTSRSLSQRTPTGKHMTRFIQLLDAVTLRRPLATMRDILPPLRSTDKTIDLPEEIQFEANEIFVKAMGSIPRGSQPSLYEVECLIRHPSLQERMRLDDEPSEEREIPLEEWKQRLAEDGNWESPLVKCIIDVFNQHRYMHPGDVFVFIDQHNYFLEVLEIAFRLMDEPVPVFMYEANTPPFYDTSGLEAFRATSGTRVLLTTHGSDLDLQCANVLIQCGPKWSWDKTTAWLHRPGQRKPVYRYSISVRDCMADIYQRYATAKEDRPNRIIMHNITRADDVKTFQRHIS